MHTNLNLLACYGTHGEQFLHALSVRRRSDNTAGGPAQIQDRSSLEIDVVPLVDLPATASSTRNQPARLTSRGGGLLRQRRLLL